LIESRIGKHWFSSPPVDPQSLTLTVIQAVKESLNYTLTSFINSNLVMQAQSNYLNQRKKMKFIAIFQDLTPKEFPPSNRGSSLTFSAKRTIIFLNKSQDARLTSSSLISFRNILL
jgi:hypothetical protein